MWLNDEDEGLKNQFEEPLLQAQLKRLGRDVKMSYNKITNNAANAASLYNQSPHFTYKVLPDAAGIGILNLITAALL